MQIVLFGAGGHVGQHIAHEALDRGHHVTAAVRDPAALESHDERLRVVQGDATDAANVARVARGADAVVNAISPRPSPTGRAATSLVDAARALIAGATQAGVPRLVVVGGAGSLEAAPGVQIVDTPSFPDGYKPEALAQRDALDVYRAEAGDLDWTYVSPAAEIGSGERTGSYRTGGDQLLVDARGRSFISYEDYAAAILDVLEQRAHPRRRARAGPLTIPIASVGITV